jgi:FkbH-like protein
MTNSSNDPVGKRGEFVAALQAGEKFKAIRLAKTLLSEDSGLRQLTFFTRELEKISRGALGLRQLKVALLSSFSIEFLKQPLLVWGFLNGIDVDLYLAGFGQFQQEIRNPRSGLYAFSPEVVILAAEGKDWLPEIYRDYLGDLASGSEGFDALLSRFSDEFRSLLRSFRENCQATLLVNNFAPPTWCQLGILDGHTGSGQVQRVHALNDSLGSICRENPGVMMVDYAGLVSRHGSLRWYDDRMDYYTKAPIAVEMLPHLSAEYMKFLRGITGQTRKCLVLDLDNTLWGGVLGEDGLDGIQVGSVYPGNAYLAFQAEVLNLQKRGVLLAIASKNNVADVDDVFTKHSGMLLKREHFAASQVHWGQKSDSLREIARQLNIGLEHMVFADDNPAEIEEIARSLPMVTTIALPKHPEHFVRSLLEEGLFDGINYSVEDRRRGELYRQRDEAELLRAQSGSLEDFYRSLDMEATFSPVDKSSLVRSAQLTQKTNQFNVTTIRLSESELAEHARNPNWLLATISVRDRFGDNGIVGLLIARVDSGILNIETLLLSCRVIGRGVETAMLAYLCDQALRRSARVLQGRIVPTAKNVPVRDLYSRHGFEKIAESESGETSWKLDLAKGPIAFPEWLRVVSDLAVTTVK